MPTRLRAPVVAVMVPTMPGRDVARRSGGPPAAGADGGPGAPRVRGPRAGEWIFRHDALQARACPEKPLVEFAPRDDVEKTAAKTKG
jgi:hypothetical protein